MKTVSEDVKRHNSLIGEIDSLYHEAALKFKLNDTELKILYTLCNIGEECPLSEIRRLTGLAKQTINSGIRKLESEKFISLEKSGSKTKNVRLTEGGKSLASRTAVRLLKIETEIFESWSPEEIQTYLALTERFAQNLKSRMQELDSND